MSGAVGRLLNAYQDFSPSWKSCRARRCQCKSSARISHSTLPLLLVLFFSSPHNAHARTDCLVPRRLAIVGTAEALGGRVVSSSSRRRALPASARLQV